MRTRALLLGSLTPLLIVFACDTGNGNTGPFGQTYTLDGGTPSTKDGGNLSTDDSGFSLDSSTNEEGGNTQDGATETDAGCTNVVAVIAGGSASAFGATYTLGAWKATSLATNVGGNAGTDNPAGQITPAIATLSDGSFLAIMRTTDNTLHSASWSGGAWSAVKTVGTASARDRPSLAVVGTSAHVIYQDPTYKYFHGTYTAGAWDTATDPVGGAAALQSFGPSAPSAIGVGTEILTVFSGDSSTDGGTGALNEEEWMAGTWGAASNLATPLSYFQASPAIAPISSGTLDALVVYADSTGTHLLNWTARIAATKAFTTPAVLSTTAMSNVGLSLAALPSGKFVLTFWGQNQEPYYSIGTLAGQAMTWTTPAALVASTNPVLGSPPVVSAGVCGDDAVAAYAQAGSAFVTRLRGTTWTPPENVTGVTGASAVAISSH